MQLRDENEYTNDACNNLEESQRHQDEWYCIIKMVLYYFVYITASKRQNYSGRKDQWGVGEDMSTKGQPERIFWG